MSDIHPKITRTGHTQAMESGAVKNKSEKKGDGRFGKILADQTQTTPSEKNLQTIPSEPLPGLSEIEGAFNLQRLTPLPAESSQLAEKLVASLDLFEKYAAFLSDPDKNLKQAYGVLEQVLARVQTLAGEMEQQQWSETESSPAMKTGMKDILNQLLVSARVEQIKFDRGDYL